MIAMTMMTKKPQEGSLSISRRVLTEEERRKRKEEGRLEREIGGNSASVRSSEQKEKRKIWNQRSWIALTCICLSSGPFEHTHRSISLCFWQEEWIMYAPLFVLFLLLLSHPHHHEAFLPFTLLDRLLWVFFFGSTSTNSRNRSRSRSWSRRNLRPRLGMRKSQGLSFHLLLVKITRVHASQGMSDVWERERQTHKNTGKKEQRGRGGWTRTRKGLELPFVVGENNWNACESRRERPLRRKEKKRRGEERGGGWRGRERRLVPAGRETERWRWNKKKASKWMDSRQSFSERWRSTNQSGWGWRSCWMEERGGGGWKGRKETVGWGRRERERQKKGKKDKEPMNEWEGPKDSASCVTTKSFFFLLLLLHLPFLPFHLRCLHCRTFTLWSSCWMEKRIGAGWKRMRGPAQFPPKPLSANSVDRQRFFDGSAST